MHLVSVNIGAEQPVPGTGSKRTTGIFKEPTDAPVAIGPLGLAGDRIVDTEHHGGVDQAVYVYTVPDYAWWSQELGRALDPGTFGENLTLSELASADLCVGDRLRVGGALLEVTAPRIPCATLAARIGDPQFVKRFRDAGRPGVYCRVIEAGTVRVGDPVELTPCAGATISVGEFFRLFYQRHPGESDLRRLLAGPIHYKMRAEYERQLAAIARGRDDQDA